MTTDNCAVGEGECSDLNRMHVETFEIPVPTLERAHTPVGIRPLACSSCIIDVGYAITCNYRPERELGLLRLVSRPWNELDTDTVLVRPKVGWFMDFGVKGAQADILATQCEEAMSTYTWQLNNSKSR